MHDVGVGHKPLMIIRSAPEKISFVIRMCGDEVWGERMCDQKVWWVQKVGWDQNPSPLSPYLRVSESAMCTSSLSSVHNISMT